MDIKSHVPGASSVEHGDNNTLLTVVGGKRFLNLTGAPVLIADPDDAREPIHIGQSVPVSRAVSAQPVWEVKDLIAGMKVYSEIWGLVGSLPAPAENTYVIVPKNVLRTKDARGRTDLLAPVSPYTNGDWGVCYKNLIDRA